MFKPKPNAAHRSCSCQQLSLQWVRADTAELYPCPTGDFSARSAPSFPLPGHTLTSSSTSSCPPHVLPRSLRLLADAAPGTSPASLSRSQHKAQPGTATSLTPQQSSCIQHQEFIPTPHETSQSTATPALPKCKATPNRKGTSKRPHHGGITAPCFSCCSASPNHPSYATPHPKASIPFPLGLLQLVMSCATGHPAPGERPEPELTWAPPALARDRRHRTK